VYDPFACLVSFLNPDIWVFAVNGLDQPISMGEYVWNGGKVARFRPDRFMNLMVCRVGMQCKDA
jgi:hypothetical protein